MYFGKPTFGWCSNNKVECFEEFFVIMINGTNAHSVHSIFPSLKLTLESGKNEKGCTRMGFSFFFSRLGWPLQVVDL